MKFSKEKFFNHLGYKILKFILTSAPFALLLSIAFFWYETNNNDKEFSATITNLKQIEQSISTKCIGVFPNYLDKINELLSEENNINTTQITIFVDVLFYGAFYNGAAFKEMIRQQHKLSSSGKKMIIAYYNNIYSNNGTGRQFREIVQLSWMRQGDINKLMLDRTQLMDSLRRLRNQGRILPGTSTYFTADSIVSEKYFALYRNGEKEEFRKRIKNVLNPLYEQETDLPLFKEIDEVKNEYLNKPADKIIFNDIYATYQKMTDLLINFYKTNGVKLIPLDESLTMSCWSNGQQVLFAFPAKFAANEIGFISHDNDILEYINTMLTGLEIRRERK